MDRAVTPVAGVALLVALTVLAAATVAVGAFALDPVEQTDRIALSATVDAETNRVGVTHDGGSVVEVRDVEVRITVDGDPLSRQPPVPFFVARGFRAGPTGPFNRRAASEWRAGERASLRLASTNEPQIDPGDAVRITVRSNGAVLGRVRTSAR